MSELVDYRQARGTLSELSQRAITRPRAGIGIVFQRFNLSPK